MKILFITIALFILILSSVVGILAQSPINLDLTSPDATDKKILLTARQPGVLLTDLIVLDTDGTIVKWHTETAGLFDFKMIDSFFVYNNTTDGVYHFADMDFTTVFTIGAVGYPKADHHDIQQSPTAPDRYLIIVFKDSIQDLSAFGGFVTATVRSLVLQEVDQAGNLYFEWDSLNHIPITHTNRSLTRTVVNYVHGNAIDYDCDGNILASGRHIDAVIKVNRATGTLMWTLGGVGNDFTFTNDAGFALLHDIRRLGPGCGNITLFDNGEQSRGYSRAVEYEVNETTKTITRVWEHRGPHARFSGSARRLDTGHTLINFGSTGVISEVTPAGGVVFGASVTQGFSYRAIPFDLHLVWLPVVMK